MTDRLPELLVDVLWQSSAWLAAGLALAWLLRRRPARAHAVLVATSLAALTTPLVTAFARARGWGLLAPTWTDDGAASATAPPLDAAPIVESGASSAWWPVALLTLWCVVSLLLAVRLVTSIRAGARLAHDGRPVPGGAQRAARAARAMQLDRAPILLTNSIVSSPVIWCWGRRPRVLLPAGYAPADAGSFDDVLCHELAHWKRRDHLSSLAAEVLVGLLPWHPLAWCVRRRVRDLAEYACDEWVLARGASPSRYAEALLRLLPSARPEPALAAVSTARGLAARVERILGPPIVEPRSGRGWTMATVAAIALLTATAALARPRATPPLELDVRSTAPAPAMPEQLATLARVDGAAIAAVPGTLDFGVVAPGAVGRGAVWLVNVGTEPRRVERAVPSCGCTTVSAFEARTIAPGESLRIELSMSAPTKPGVRKRKTVSFVLADGDPVVVPLRVETSLPPPT